MSGFAIARSSLTTSLKRYSRSWALWLVLLAGPIGARFMIARDDGTGVQIAIRNHLPIMTSGMLGVSLGIVVSTLLLPIAYLYLRSNVTRRQPWQIEEVTAAQRIPIALGRWAADASVMLGMLATLTLAGWFLGWLIVSGPLDLIEISWTLWLIAAPSFMGLAAIRILFDAMRWTRGAWGDVAFLILWLVSIAMPAAVSSLPTSFAVNMYDFPGFVRPMVGTAPSAGPDFSIGSTNALKPGRVRLNVFEGLYAEGYIASRFAWAGIAVLVAALAGLVYQPHTVRRKGRIAGAIDRLTAAGPPPVVIADAPPARSIALPFAGLVLGEFRLIGSGRLFLLAGAGVVIAGLFGDYRHIGSPAALLLLVFGLVAHAGRSEARGLLALTQTTFQPPMLRRLAFVLAGTGWALLLALPAAAVRFSVEPVVLALAVGAAASVVAVVLATISRSAFAPRLVLLVLWYGYLSS
ncbi:MAG: hypothetical protein K2W81_11385 [Sphingomonas sp.]|uniref:hypothetical protein n=1 Tax=Sphingomonas sp. TaxID=28214 RepID=UPI0025F5E002|nr:hypothetical protein [Sphingomonas sp.]MBY0284552.1 hypothetical protein [Sphingomonas sp.]